MLRTALIRGAFDYPGQKCSAASRAFIPRSVWQRMGDDFLSATEALRCGDVTDLSNHGGAVIDDRAFAKNVKAIERAKSAAGVTVAAGGEYDDRAAVLAAQQRLRHTAGNFYVNGKPTGAVVGQQPFGGSRASGTNEEAGSPLNLLRWTSARSIKETFAPSTDHNYPDMEG